jgi:hypothetical protein
MNLDEIKKRCEAATPGPWRWADWGAIFGTREKEMFTLESSPLRSWWWSACVLSCEQEPDEPADKAFIAHAREDVPALVAEVERLQKLLEPGTVSAMLDAVYDALPPEQQVSSAPPSVYIGKLRAVAEAARETVHLWKLAVNGEQFAREAGAGVMTKLNQALAALEENKPE